MEDEDDYYNNDDYYNTDGDGEEHMEENKDDPEYFDFELLKVEDVERLLNESVEALCKSINVSNKMTWVVHGIASCLAPFLCIKF